MKEPGKQRENKTALSKPETKKQVSRLVAVPGKQRRANWTYVEIIGLALAFFLLVWPAISFTTEVIAPTSTHAAPPFVDLISKTTTPGTVSPGGAITFKFTAQTSAVASGNPTVITFNDNNLPGSMSCTSIASSSLTPINSNLPTAPGGSVAITFLVTSTSPVVLNVNVNCTAPAAAGTYTNTLSIDASNGDGVAFGLPTSAVNFTVSGAVTATPTNTPVTATPTNTPIPTATNTPLPGTPTNTPIPATATNTPLPGTPTNTPIPATATNTPLPGTPTATPTTSIVQTPVPPIPTQTPVPGAPTNTPTTSSGSNATATPVATSTPTPTATNVPSALSPAAPGSTTVAAAATSVPPSGTGVIAGSVVNKAGSVAGAPIDLIWAKVSGEQVVATAVIDSSGQFFFGGVGSTGTGEAYYLRFRNSDPGGTTLRSFIVKSFSFTSGSITRVDNIDVTDVSIGAPGAAGQTITPPFTFDWFNRGAGDTYSLTFFDANGQIALDTGNLGGATSFVLPTGKLPNGQYSVQVNVANGKGTGISNKRFSFRIGVAGAATTTAVVTTTAAVRPATTVAAGANSTPVTTRTSIPAGTTTTAVGTSAAASASATTATSPLPSPTPLQSGVANVPGGELIGNQPLPDANASTTPIVNPANTGGSLPKSGGELPIAGLALAAFTLIGRRVRLIRQSQS